MLNIRQLHTKIKSNHLSSLGFELAIILIIKAIILYCIWHAFFDEQHQEPTVDSVSIRFLDSSKQGKKE